MKQKPLSIFGVHVDPLRVEDIHSAMYKTIKSKQKIIISNVNIHALNIAYSIEWFREFLNNSEIVFCDGYGVKLAANFLDRRLPERITYADWMWELAKFASENSFTLFFLGGKPGISLASAERLRERHPHLQVLGTMHGYFNKNRKSAENSEVVNQINSKKPNILIIGFGMPLQEHWLMENWGDLNVNVALPGGAVFDYISSELKRGPKWMTDHGLEWLARLAIEPRRLWKRYLVGNPLFMWRILKQKLGLLKF